MALLGCRGASADEQAILAEMDRMQALITPVLEDAGMSVRLAAASADAARRMVRRRRAAILDERADMPPRLDPRPARAALHLAMADPFRSAEP